MSDLFNIYCDKLSHSKKVNTGDETVCEELSSKSFVI